jgi:hypothetical protein
VKSLRGLEGYFEALEGPNLGKSEWYDSVMRIHNIATLVHLIGILVIRLKNLKKYTNVIVIFFGDYKRNSK